MRTQHGVGGHKLLILKLVVTKHANSGWPLLSVNGGLGVGEDDWAISPLSMWLPPSVNTPLVIYKRKVQVSTIS
eukprot:c40899_g2_i1 orf=97-318(+)